MLNLILKDLMVQRKTLLWGFLYVLIFSYAFSTGGSAMFTAGAFAVAYLLIQTPAAHDDKCNADRMLNSLPISRGMIVTAKYLSVVVYVAIGVVQYIAVYAIVSLIGQPFPVYPATWEAFGGLLFVSAFFASVYYPILFRFGFMKTRYLTIILFAGLFASGSAVVLALKQEDSLPFLSSLGELFNAQPGWLIGCCVAGVMLAMLLVSWSLSVRFYARREF